MAIDTETKRRSVLGYTLGVALVLPVADSSITVGDRAHVAGLYAGLSVAAAVPDAALIGMSQTGPTVFGGATSTGPTLAGASRVASTLVGDSHT